MHHIRPATQADINRMSEIEQLCFPESEAASLQSFIDRFAVFPECFFVLEVDGVIVGHINGCVYHSPELPDELYANPSMHCPDGKYQTVFGLVVHPDFQRNGYASRLTEHLIEISRQRNHFGIVLTCKDKLINFYQSNGFVCQGVSASSHGGANWNDMLLSF
ncbi:GNAT family N-acetyltransferase [Vibrio sp. RC27]